MMQMAHLKHLPVSDVYVRFSDGFSPFVIFCFFVLSVTSAKMKRKHGPKKKLLLRSVRRPVAGQEVAQPFHYYGDRCDASLAEYVRAPAMENKSEPAHCEPVVRRRVGPAATIRFARSCSRGFSSAVSLLPSAARRCGRRESRPADNERRAMNPRNNKKMKN